MAVFPIGFGTIQSLPQHNEMVPLGGIIQWSGAIVDIPAGYAICDGNNGTPDLRNKFVIGAGDTYAPDAVGGAVNHTHEFTGNGHVHPPGIATDAALGADESLWDAFSPSADGHANGTTDSDGSLPPYLALAYIMRTV